MFGPFKYFCRSHILFILTLLLLPFLFSCAKWITPHRGAESQMITDEEYDKMLIPVHESLRDIRIPVFKCNKMALAEAVHKINELAQKNSGGKFVPRIYLNLSHLEPARAREAVDCPVSLFLRDVELGRLITFLCCQSPSMYHYEPGAVVIQPFAPVEFERKSYRPAWGPGLDW